MKRRWLKTLCACVLPPVIGVGVCYGMMQLLKDHEMFRPAGFTLPTAKVSSQRQGRLNETSAEIRAALPVGGTFESDVPPRMPTLPDKEAIRIAAKPKKKAEPVIEPAEKTSPPQVAALPAPSKPAEVKPAVWRPVIDPISEFWTSLMPRTDALPQAYQAVLNGDAAHLARLIALGVSPHQKTLGGDTPSAPPCAWATRNACACWPWPAWT